MSFTRAFLFLSVVVALSSVLPACRKTGSGNGTSATAGTPPPAPAVPASTATAEIPTSKHRPRAAVAPLSARNDELWYLAHRGTRDMSLICARGSLGRSLMTASVTHYFIDPGVKIGDSKCRNGNGYFGQPAMAGTCLHPCRSLAADPRFYRPGEILFFPSLVGLTCGSGRNKMIHDGFMVVTDNGNPEAINIEGRFGVFWGRCKEVENGFCKDDGAIALDFALTFSPYCRAWRPQDPLHHDDLKLAIYNQVRSEAVKRGDNQAASSFDLDEWIGIGMRPDGLLFKRH